LVLVAATTGLAVLTVACDHCSSAYAHHKSWRSLFEARARLSFNGGNILRAQNG